MTRSALLTSTWLVRSVRRDLFFDRDKLGIGLRGVISGGVVNPFGELR